MTILRAGFCLVADAACPHARYLVYRAGGVEPSVTSQYRDARVWRMRKISLL